MRVVLIGRGGKRGICAGLVLWVGAVFWMFGVCVGGGKVIYRVGLLWDQVNKYQDKCKKISVSFKLFFVLCVCSWVCLFK